MTKVETIEQGYNAYWEGVDVADNPHDPADEPDEHKSWEDGWREARQARPRRAGLVAVSCHCLEQAVPIRRPGAHTACSKQWHTVEEGCRR